jgi:hypothetical protein
MTSRAGDDTSTLDKAPQKLWSDAINFWFSGERVAKLSKSATKQRIVPI